jgi:hypothetical protein
MQANPLREQVGGGWALEIKNFLGPVKSLKWHSVSEHGGEKGWRVRESPPHHRAFGG